MRKGKSRFFGTRRVATPKGALEWANQFETVIGFTGFTKPPSGSDYMENAEAMVHETIARIQDGTSTCIGVVYGSSDAGIDQIVEEVCAELQVSILGITCDQFAEWVPDEAHRPPVVVCRTVAKYGDLFTDILDILYVTGGRDHALKHDVAGTLSKGGTVVVIDCAPGFDSAAKTLTENLNVVGRYTQTKKPTREKI